MDLTFWAGCTTILLALFFDFSNGFHDSANQVATAISSRTLSPETALLLAASFDFIGAYFLGTAVATTIGKGIIHPEAIPSARMGLVVLASALTGATCWNLLTWYFGMPASSSHALIGGMVGAFLAGWGKDPIQWQNLKNIFIVLLLSPLLGFVATYMIAKLTFFLGQWLPAKANGWFKNLQILSLMGQSLAHGTNDAQKTMGVIAFALFLMGRSTVDGNSGFFIPQWVILACSLTMAFGVLTGGWRIIRTLGSGLYRVRAIHGFAAQSSSAVIMCAASFLGFPVSTTQVISSSVMGAGAAFRAKAVRWAVASDMLGAWLLTIPASALAAAIIFKLAAFLFLN